MNIPLDKFADWLRNKNLKERTIENYLYYFNKFSNEVFNQETVSRFLSAKPNQNTIARSFLLNYKKFLLVNHVEFNLSADLRAAIASVELPKLTGRKKQRLIKPVAHEDIAKIEQFLPTEKLKLQLLLSYYCAFRLGELFKMTIVSFDWDTWKKDITKRGRCRVLGKGDKEGIALIPAFLMQRVARYIRSTPYQSLNDYIFRDPNKEYNFNNLARDWQLKLSKAAIEAGVTILDTDGKPIKDTRVHPHRLRHSYASYLVNVKNMNLKKVQKVLRHADISSTQIYVHVDMDDIEKDLDKE